MPLVKPRAPFFAGARSYTPGDVPFEIDENLARVLVADGLVEMVAEIPIEIDADSAKAIVALADELESKAVDPAPARTERSTARNHRKRK